MNSNRAVWKTDISFTSYLSGFLQNCLFKKSIFHLPIPILIAEYKSHIKHRNKWRAFWYVPSWIAVYIIARLTPALPFASPFTPASFVSLSTKNLKSIKDHGINAKITVRSIRNMKNVRAFTWAVRNKTANHYETVSSTIKEGSLLEIASANTYRGIERC